MPSARNLTILCARGPGTVILLLIFILLATPLSELNAETVVSVLDGDTVVLESGERVRLIGVDTTESAHPLKPVEYFAEEAKNFTKNLLLGKVVTLNYDQETRDKYGRLLAYLYLLDNTFANAEIIRNGYGFAYIKYPFRYKTLFVDLEREARENKRGYWATGGKGELTWVVEKGQHPFLIYQMSQGLWGVRYGEFVKTRLTDEPLLETLNSLRRWVNEFHEQDLAKELLNSGWERGGGK